MKLSPHPMKKLLLAVLAASGAAHSAPLPPAFTDQLNASYPALESFYQDLHRTPELAFNEHQTAAKLAARAKALGFDVTTGVGGTGVVAILRNGPGPTVMLRTETDALPVLEKTGLAFSSAVTTKNAAGDTIPVMHACGHDLHMAAWFGTAKLMAENRKAWSGTLMLVGQPAEETVAGAAAMLKDGLFTRFPKPDYALSMHDDASGPSGVIMYHAGAFRASSDVVNITMFGQGGHGAVPQSTRDPIVMAARLVLALQTLVSRENDPLDPVVITIGKINGGVRENIIPEELTMAGTIRTLDDAMQKDVHERVKMTAQKIAESMGATAEVSIETKTLVTYNTPELVNQMLPSLEKAIGKSNVYETEWTTGAEDFSYYRLKAPAFFFNVGGMPKDKTAKTSAPHHTPDFYIDDSRLDVGIKAFCNIVFDYQPLAKTVAVSNKKISAEILSQQVPVENYFPAQFFDVPFRAFALESILLSENFGR